jgi:hypothetical protein
MLQYAHQVGEEILERQSGLLGFGLGFRFAWDDQFVMSLSES